MIPLELAPFVSRRRPRRRLVAISCVVATLLVGWGGAAVAQSDEEEVVGSFLDQVDVKVINVPVFVRDKKGNPITGLTIDDFELTEKGRPIKITNFYEVAEGTRTDREEEPSEVLPVAEAERLRSHPELDRRTRDVPDDERLYLVVYVDHQNIRPHNRNRVFRDLRAFLRRNLDRQDRVMLVSYNRSVKIERQFTSDPHLIATALYELEKHTGGRTNWDAERRDLLRELQDARRGNNLEGRVRLHAQSIYNDLQFTLDGLKDILEWVAGLPGRKAFLYLSDGLPMVPGMDMWTALEERARQEGGQQIDTTRFLESMQYDASRRFTDIANTANANGVVMYTIDASGPLGVNSRGADVGGGFAFSNNVDSVAIDNLQTSVMYMADETGGQFVVNTNAFARGFERIATDFDHYYSLGFSPPHAGAGRQYSIKVELRKALRKGKDVRHPGSYRDKSLEREMSETTLASLRFNYQKNELGISVHPVEAIPRDDGNFLVHADVRIPIGNLALLPSRDEHVARVRVWIQALDREGATSPVQVETITLNIPNDEVETAKKQYQTYEMKLLMRPGSQRVAVSVRDDIGAKSSFVNQVMNVGSGRGA